jgi:hypothetical protein
MVKLTGPGRVAIQSQYGFDEESHYGWTEVGPHGTWRNWNPDPSRWRPKINEREPLYPQAPGRPLPRIPPWGTLLRIARCERGEWRGAKAGATMFIHSLWSQTSDPLPAFSAEVSDLLGPPEEGDGEQRAQWHQSFSASADPDSADAAWQPSIRATPVSQHLSIYRVASFVGIASPDPALNFRIRERFSDNFKIFEPRLNWTENRPQQVAGEWELCAIHLRDRATGIEVISQGAIGSGAALVGQLDRFDDADVVGISLASGAGRLITMYDAGQVWLQQLRPYEVPYLLEPVLVELLGGTSYAYNE